LRILFKKSVALHYRARYRIADFEKFQDIFTRVRTEDISHYKDIALQTMKKQRVSSTTEEKNE
jgi:hypothetical protein